MPSSNTIKLLEESLQQASDAAGHLKKSIERCKGFGSSPPYTEEQLIDLEALTGRFARVSDLLVQKVLKTIQRLDRDTPGTVRDRILQSEQKGIIPSAEMLLDIRDIRNTIAHDYDGDSFNEIVLFVFQNTSFLLQGVETAMEYSKKFY
jgi:uncharacterized protein YutE (UPF0331/DUF86 family)